MSDDASGTTVAATSWHPAGVCYASTDEGTRLPVVDITNQAFAIEVGVDDLPAFAEASRRSLEHWARVPRWLRRPLERRSLLLGDTSGRSAYVSGLTTYLLKLGPEPLAASIGLGGLDRRAAGAISSVAVRYRLRAVARLLADGLLPRLAADDGTPLLLLNLGGGPASDSLNALLLIRRERPELLRGRSVTIAVLDVDTVGPAFGRRCLDALVAPGAPLAGLDATFDVVPYDWADSSALRGLLNDTGPAEPIVAVSSEGALFEYGRDEEIAANLAELHEDVPRGSFVVGSLFRDQPVTWVLKGMGDKSFAPRELGPFGKLVETAGWTLERSLSDNPVYHVVSLSES